MEWPLSEFQLSEIVVMETFCQVFAAAYFYLFDPLVVVAIRISQEPFLYAEMT